MNHVRIEFIERGRRVFAPKSARQGCVRRTIETAAEVLGVRFHRARDLLRGRACPRVEEIDIVRELDGVWCRKEARAKPDLMERMHDKIDALYSAYVERREAKRARKDFMQRVAAE